MVCFQNLHLHPHSAIYSEREELQANLSELRVPLQNGWKRETVMKGLTESMEIHGDVFYYVPGNQMKLTNTDQIEKVEL